MIRARPKFGAGKLSTYWPPGDIMNFWRTLLRVALERMTPQARPPYVQNMLDQHGISDVVLFQAAQRYIQAMRLAYEDPDVDTLDKALAHVGFHLSPLGAQAIVFMIIGELTTGIYIAGLKDTTPMGDNGIRDDVESLVQAAEQHTQRLQNIR